jgi:hypothetical protein
MQNTEPDAKEGIDILSSKRKRHQGDGVFPKAIEAYPPFSVGGTRVSERRTVGAPEGLVDRDLQGGPLGHDQDMRAAGRDSGTRLGLGFEQQDAGLGTGKPPVGILTQLLPKEGCSEEHGSGGDGPKRHAHGQASGGTASELV